jgi:cell shape-determining protein MreC
MFQGLFVGRVIAVGSDYATVQTVFDNDFKMPVRVGSGGYDGLLTGGSYPFVASIAKKSSIGINDIIYTAAPGIPYALPVGEVQSTSTSADNLFEQATLVFPYDVNNIETVLIAK